VALDFGRRLHNMDRAGVRTATLTAFGVLLIAVIAAAVWALTPLGPSSNALSALKPADGIEVAALSEGWLFTPTEDAADVGLVLYPGGRVDARSYAPLARAVAERGYVVALASMPLNLAVLDPGRARALEAAAPGVSRWAVGGHSLGGAMAAAYATEGDSGVRGLVLLAAYPPSSSDLRDSGLRVLSVLGDRDAVVNRDNWDDGVRRLPTDTVYLTLPGGNHAQFGDYGPQPGDGEAALPRAEQQRLTVEAIAELLASL